jgi:hypothetical protein
VPNASAAAFRTGSNVSASNFVQLSPIIVVSAFVGANGVVRKHRTRNRKLSVFT